MRELLEKLAKFAGEPEQKPGDQVKGTDKAKAKKDGKHPFAGKLVGASESAEPKSMLKDLSQAIDKNSLEWQLSEEFSQFRDEERLTQLTETTNEEEWQGWVIRYENSKPSRWMAYHKKRGPSDAHKSSAETPQEAVAAAKEWILSGGNAREISTSTSLTIDFNVKFVADILNGGREFYAKIIPGPTLIISDTGSPGFKRSHIRNQRNKITGETLLLPMISLSGKEAQAAGLKAHGRYILGDTTKDSAGNMAFPLIYQSTVQTKSDKMRLNKPALTVAMNRGPDGEGAVNEEKENFGTQEKRKGRKTRERTKDEGVLEAFGDDPYAEVDNTIEFVLKQWFGGKAWFDGGSYSYLMDVKKPNQMIASDGSIIDIASFAQGVDVYADTTVAEDFFDLHHNADTAKEFFRPYKARRNPQADHEADMLGEGIEDADVSSIIVDEITKLIGDGHTEVAPDVIIAKVSAATGAPFMLKDLVAANNASPELQHYIDSINPSKVKFSTDILTVKNEDPMKEKEQAQAGVANMAARAANRDRSLGESTVGAVAGGVAGAALGKTPQAAMMGAQIGDELAEDARWEKLRDAYKVIQTIDPSSPTYLKLIKFLDGLSTEDLQSLADANIKFVSGLARNRVNRRAQELNELSPQTLQNYIDKAEPQGKEHNARSMMGMQNAQDFEQKMADRAIAKKRLRGTSLAKKKLSSVEEGQEINKKEWKRTERGLDHSTYTHLPSGAQVYSIKRIESYTRAGRTRDRADSRTYTDWGWKLPNGRSDWGAGSMRAAMYIVNQWWEQQQSVTEGWGAESQKRAHEESQAAWNSLFAKYENDPEMTAKLQKLHRNNWKASYAEIEAKKTSNESRGHKIVQRKLKDIESRSKPQASEEEMAAFRQWQKQQAQQPKKKIGEAGANNPPQANSAQANAQQTQQAKKVAAATTTLKAATGAAAPAPNLAKAINSATQGTAVNAQDMKALAPVMNIVGQAAQDPALANQFKSLASMAKSSQQKAAQQQAKAQQQPPGTVPQK